MKSFLNIAIIVSVVSSVPLPGKQEQGGVGKAGFGGFDVTQPAQSQQAHQVVGYPYASAGTSFQYPPQQHADNGARVYGQRNQVFGTRAFQAQYPTMQGMQHDHDASKFHQHHHYGQRSRNVQAFQVVSQDSRQGHGRNYGSVVPFPDLGYASNPVAPLPDLSPVLTANVAGQGQGIGSLGPDYFARPDIDGATGNLPDTLGDGGNLDFGAADCDCAGCCVIS
ncbi:hypothetical protein MIR68_001378 [Amoeboaphelidium protococcarum]|nr:hypothetical protein MIR68_001378 [Amoeboaphelidium protococcarum]